MKAYKQKSFLHGFVQYTVNVYKTLDRRVKEGTYVQLEDFPGVWFRLSEVNRKQGFVVIENSDATFDITQIARFTNKRGV